MPVVIGHAVVALCFLASVFRIASIVVSFPRRTFFISASTSNGAGMTNVPVLPRFDFVASQMRGRSLQSANFSCHDFFLYVIVSVRWGVGFPLNTYSDCRGRSCRDFLCRPRALEAR